MSQWPLLGTSVISHCGRRSFPEHLDAIGAPRWCPLQKDQSSPFGCCRQLVWAHGQMQSHCPFQGHLHCSWGAPVLGITLLGAPSLSPKAGLCGQSEEGDRHDAQVPRARWHLMLCQPQEIPASGSGAFSSLLCLRTPGCNS